MTVTTLVPAYSGTRAVAVEAQGSLLAVAVRSDAIARPGGGRRGAVLTFSKASRRRMLRKLARLDARRPVFVTLTYPAEYPHPMIAKKHLAAFLKRIKRRLPDASAIWRMELQKRGAPHFHLIFFGLPFVSHATLVSWWQEIIGVIDSVTVFVRIEVIRSKRGVMAYASKYMAKPAAVGEQPPAGRFFNSDAYLTGEPECGGPEGQPSWSPGRWWGVFNAARLPYAARYAVAVRVEGFRMFHDAKRLLRRHYSRLSKARGKGGAVFTDDSYSLAAAVVRLLLQDVSDEWYAGDLIVIE
jgi:hypothetical protein